MPATELEQVIGLENPFPGLRPFEPAEAHLFFGRETHTEELLRRLASNRFLAVVGSSGSGKSSLVRAGLLPALQRGYLLEATTRWRIAIMRPGGAPLNALAEALVAREIPQGIAKEELLSRLDTSFGLIHAVRQAKLKPGESLLLVVDQFEELFRFARDHRRPASRSEAALFVSMLLQAAEEFDEPVFVVLTMRSDFLGDCARFPRLAEALNRSQYLIPPLTLEQRQAAIEKPLDLVGATMTPRLMQRLLRSAGSDPDQLPVLQHALMRTYGYWKSAGSTGEIDLDDYEAISKSGSALDQHAQQIYDGLPVDTKPWAEKLFRCLTTQVDGKPVRRPAKLRWIWAVTGAKSRQDRDHIQDVIGRFLQREDSLLFSTTGANPDPRSVIDIQHESLIREWKLLGTWVKQEAKDAAWFGDVAGMAQRGAAPVRDPDLGRFETLSGRGWNPCWAAQYTPKTSIRFRQVRDFLDRSRTEQNQADRLDQERRDRELNDAIKIAKAQARAKRWLWASVALLGLLLAGVLVYVQNAERMRLERAAQEEKNLKLAQQVADSQKGADDARQNLLRLQTEAANVTGKSADERQKLQQELEAARLKAQSSSSEVQKAQAALANQESQTTLQQSQAAAALAQIKELQEQLNTVRSQRDDLQKKLKSASEPVADSKEVANLRNEVSRLQKESEALKAAATVATPAPVTAAPPTKTQERVNTVDGLTYVWVLPGRFRMGCSEGDSDCLPEEKPVRDVEITRGFWLGQTEVTQAAWNKVMGAPSSPQGAQQLPRVNVNWEDARGYCAKIGGRLPTEAEWEYAARARTTGPRYGDLDATGWYSGNSGDALKPVKGKQSNAFGLYDMLGNVWEWVADWYGTYDAKALTDPKGPNSGKVKILRGGSWYNYPQNVRVSYRNWVEPTYRDDVIGVRCAGEFR